MSETPPSRDLASLAQEAARPVPPRYWWLKRFAVAALMVLLLMVISRWWWGVYASRALQAEIDKLKIAGEPTEARDFDLPPVPDELNAAIPLEEAAVIQARLDASKPKTGRPGQTPATMPEDPAQVQARVQDMARIRELVHQARLRPAVNWAAYRRGPNFSAPRHLLDYYDIIRGLHAVAVSLHQEGNDMAAFDVLEDMLSLGERVSAHRTLLAGLLQQEASKNACEALEEILPDLRSPSEAASATGGQRGTRDRVNALMSHLLDEQLLREALIRGMQSERFFQLGTIQQITTGQLSVKEMGPPRHWDKLQQWLLRPMLQLDSIAILRSWNDQVEAAKAANEPEASKRAPARPKAKPGLSEQSRLLSNLMLPNLGGTAKHWFASLARRRMAAVALAIRMYEADHGQAPATLEALMPEYLPYIPENPLRDDKSLIRYDPNPSDPCLYCPPQTGGNASRSPGGAAPPARTLNRFHLKGRPTTQPSSPAAASNTNHAG